MQALELKQSVVSNGSTPELDQLVAGDAQIEVLASDSHGRKAGLGW